MADAKKTLDQYAQDYGFQLAFLKSAPELYAKFQQAIAGKWAPDKFVLEVQKTNWFRTHGEAYRTNSALQYTDPGTWNQKVNSKIADLKDIAASYGAMVSPAMLKTLAQNAFLFNYSDSQVRDLLSHYVKPNAQGQFTGDAGNIQQKLAQTAYRNGVQISSGWISDWARRIEAGDATVEDAQTQLRTTYAASMAPAYKKELEGGMDLYDIASPYMQSMAKTLELNPADITLFDPTIRKALGGAPEPGKDGQPGTPASTPLWQFEQQLKQDPRWLKTQNAQDSTMSVAHSVLRDFGMMGN